MTSEITRRTVLQGLAAGGAAAIGLLGGRSARATAEGPALKGNIHHSVCRWCYGKIPLEELCQACQKIGIASIELVGPEEWPTLKKYGLTCAMSREAWGSPRGSTASSITSS